MAWKHIKDGWPNHWCSVNLISNIYIPTKKVSNGLGWEIYEFGAYSTRAKEIIVSIWISTYLRGRTSPYDGQYGKPTMIYVPHSYLNPFYELLGFKPVFTLGNYAHGFREGDDVTVSRNTSIIMVCDIGKITKEKCDKFREAVSSIGFDLDKITKEIFP